MKLRERLLARAGFAFGFMNRELNVLLELRDKPSGTIHISKSLIRKFLNNTSLL
ncbi:hypothetical protein [Novacetimonas hansenii]|uniref:hypothetical protein n=1 Tax=Novacetimonas hansenii TaxID=436 RepID=UPI000AC770B6